MSDTKPLPDDPDRTAATPATPPAASTDPTLAHRPAADAEPPAAAPASDPVAAPAAAASDPVAAHGAAAAPAAAGPGPAAGPAGGPVWAADAPPAAGPGRLRAAGGRLGGSRVLVPLLVGAVTLVLGCCLGAGMVAIGAAVFGDGHRGDDRGRVTRDDRAPRGGPAFRGDERDGRQVRPGQDGFRRHPSPAAPPTATATPSTPAPSSPTAS